MTTSNEDFERALALILRHEGGYSCHAGDAGNWTGGSCGEGVLRGTKYGISAAAYPELDIERLEAAEAAAIYRRDYWDKAGCADLPPRLAYVVFDAAVNNGVGRAVRWLQETLDVRADGVWGPATRAAATRAFERDPEGEALLIEFHARRLSFMVGLGAWKEFGRGWSRRLVRVPLDAADNWPLPGF
jgi:lysozyme family protein